MPWNRAGWRPCFLFQRNLHLRRDLEQPGSEAAHHQVVLWPHPGWPTRQPGSNPKTPTPSPSPAILHHTPPYSSNRYQFNCIFSYNVQTVLKNSSHFSLRPKINDKRPVSTCVIILNLACFRSFSIPNIYTMFREIPRSIFRRNGSLIWTVFL